jgi:hypothetical protein
MTQLSFDKLEATIMVLIACLGMIIPNGIFLYFCFADMSVLLNAIGNPIALVFISEAFYLMFLFAWFLNRTKAKNPRPVMFVILSLAGSMAFSVPLTLWFLFGRRQQIKHKASPDSSLE